MSVPNNVVITGTDIPTLQQQVNNLVAQNYDFNTSIGWTGTQYFIYMRYCDPIAYDTFTWRYQFTFYPDGSIPADLADAYFVYGNNGILAVRKV